MSLDEKDLLGDLSLRRAEKITLIVILQSYGVRMWDGFRWLRTGPSGGLLRTRYGNERSASRNSFTKYTPICFYRFLH
jgi:hypothetical protein